jgi:hypothetical protein
MQGKLLFEYAVIRIVPRVEREEFINVGVILYCKERKFLQAVFTLNEEKLRVLAPGIDVQEVRDYLQAFEQVCCGGDKGGPIGRLDTALRFRWLTATRSTILQTSRVHTGFCDDPAATLQKLHAQLVL